MVTAIVVLIVDGRRIQATNISNTNSTNTSTKSRNKVCHASCLFSFYNRILFIFFELLIWWICFVRWSWKRKQKKRQCRHTFICQSVAESVSLFYLRLLFPSLSLSPSLLSVSLSLSPSPPHYHHPVSIFSGIAVPSHYNHPADLVLFIFFIFILFILCCCSLCMLWWSIFTFPRFVAFANRYTTRRSFIRKWTNRTRNSEGTR